MEPDVPDTADCEDRYPDPPDADAAETTNADDPPNADTSIPGVPDHPIMLSNLSKIANPTFFSAVDSAA